MPAGIDHGGPIMDVALGTVWQSLLLDHPGDITGNSVDSGHNPKVQPDHLHPGFAFCVDWTGWLVVDTLVDDAAQLLSTNTPVHAWVSRSNQP